MATSVSMSSDPPSNGGHACQPGSDGCWSKIGVAGDRTCPELRTFIHCRNCPVFATAARTFFDRPAPEGYLAAWSTWLAGSVEQVPGDERGERCETDLKSPESKFSVLIFRLGSEWLAFRTSTVAEVTTPRPIHRVPHRTNEVLRGLVTLQGQAQLCVSLHGLLGVTASGAPSRLVVLRDCIRSETWVYPADEVLGVHDVPRSDWRGVRSTLVNPTVGFSQAILSWQDRSVGVLDEQRVFAALRSLGP